MSELRSKPLHWFSGIRNLDQLNQAEVAGADFIVCHQHPVSMRFCSIKDTAEIRKASHKPVWVQFENDHIAVIKKILNDVNPQGIVFNGSEEPQFCEQFGLPYARRFSLKDGIGRFQVDRFQKAQFIIVDAYAPPSFGDYVSKAYLWDQLVGLDLDNLILAGQIPFEKVRDLQIRLGLQGFEWSAELEDRPLVWGREKLEDLAKLIHGWT